MIEVWNIIKLLSERFYAMILLSNLPLDTLLWWFALELASLPLLELGWSFAWCGGTTGDTGGRFDLSFGQLKIHGCWSLDQKDWSEVIVNTQ